MILASRHYVSIATRGLRRHRVMKSVLVKTGGRTHGIRYEVVSRHFTHRRAVERARVLNARNGRAH